MCGRFVGSRDATEIAAEFDVRRVETSETLAPDYNVAPTKRVHVVLERDSDGDGPLRQLRDLRWGLVPSWASSSKAGAKMINARAETAADKPAFRRALKTRRCLVPADGYFEWHADEGGRRQPHFIHSDEPLALAGLYELWRDPSRERGDPAAWLATFTILTTAAAPNIAWLHHRMPLVVAPDRQAAWLDPARTRPDPLGALVDEAPRLRAYPVSTEVNSPRNNGPQLLRPVA